jgi:hypothetical protein
VASDLFDRLRGVVDALERADVDGFSVANEVRVLHHLRARLDAQIARRVDVLDRSGEWVADGARSCAAWVRRACRVSERDARATVRMAKQVREMPSVGELWAAGAITTGHVDVLTRARLRARADESFAAFEDQLANVALHAWPEDVERVARQWRDALDADRQPDETMAVQQYESRALFLSKTLDGRWIENATYDAEGGGYVDRAIKHMYDAQHKANDERAPAQQRSDAMVSICRRYLDGLPRGSNKPHVMVLGDVDTITGTAVGLSETDQGLRISPETLRRIACDSLMWTAAVNAEGVVLDLGRATRTFTPEQARALQAQYPTCVVPGCNVRSVDCQMHHVDPAEDGGPTDLGNGVPVCGHDHHRFHEYGWTITRDPITGEVNVYAPDGTHAGTTLPRRRPEPIPLRR